MHRSAPELTGPDCKEDVVIDTRVCVHCNNWNAAMGCRLVCEGLIEFKRASECNSFTRGYEDQF